MDQFLFFQVHWNSLCTQRPSIPSCVPSLLPPANEITQKQCFQSCLSICSGIVGSLYRASAYSLYRAPPLCTGPPSVQDTAPPVPPDIWNCSIWSVDCHKRVVGIRLKCFLVVQSGWRLFLLTMHFSISAVPANTKHNPQSGDRSCCIGFWNFRNNAFEPADPLSQSLRQRTFVRTNAMAAVCYHHWLLHIQTLNTPKTCAIEPQTISVKEDFEFATIWKCWKKLQLLNQLSIRHFEVSFILTSLVLRFLRKIQ